MALTSIMNTASAQSMELQEKVKNYFLQTLKAQKEDVEKGREAFVKNMNADTDICEAIKPKAVADYQKMVWEAWREANSLLDEEKIIAPQDLKSGANAAWSLPATLEPNAKMPYYYGVKEGEKAGREGLPLFVYLHGSGPKMGEWTTGLKLAQMFDDAPCKYFIPQIPNEGNYYRWWQLAKQFAWEKLFRQTLADGRTDANRLYLFGISEGGYGSQRLASFYADYLAAAGPMAGGEPLKNAPVENCANIGFSFLTGADDQGFYRNILTYYTQQAFDSAQLARPLSADGKPLFRHRINLIPGMQHSIPYALTTPWLKQFVRNPHPKTVLWEDFEMDGRRRSGFYNLQVMERPSEGRTFYDMSIADNVITLNISNVTYTTTQTDKQWGIEMKFARSFTPASGGRVRIYLNSELVDLTKDVTVIINGREVFRGKAKCDVANLINSCSLYFDPYRLFASSLEVGY